MTGQLPTTAPVQLMRITSPRPPARMGAAARTVVRAAACAVLLVSTGCGGYGLRYADEASGKACNWSMRIFIEFEADPTTRTPRPVRLLDWAELAVRAAVESPDEQLRAAADDLLAAARNGTVDEVRAANDAMGDVCGQLVADAQGGWWRRR